MNSRALSNVLTDVLRPWPALCFAVWLLCLTPPAGAQFGGGFPTGESTERVTLDTEWSHTAVAPGTEAVLAIHLKIDAGWHVQANQVSNPDFIPTTLSIGDWPGGFVGGDIQWPETKPAEYLGETYEFFVDGATIFVKVSVPDTAEPGDVTLPIDIRYQACDDRICEQPKTVTLTSTLTVTEDRQAVEARNTALFEQYTGGGGGALAFAFFGLDFELDAELLWALLLLAALGGFLLNFTPCVLPMIPIKIMSLSRAADQKHKTLLLGGVMALGVVTFWMAIGVAIASITGFDAINELFQYPAFTIGVGVVIAIMGLGMWGLFTVQLPQAVYMVNPSQDTAAGSFLFGVMTAVLATPCTAPFMGSVAVWAATQESVIVLSTFGAIGVGMALPYFVLALFPKLIDRMPRTGPASELIKQVMGLLILAAASYFIGTGLAGVLSSPPDPSSKAYWYPVGFFILAAGAWLIYRTVRITPRIGRRLAFGGLGMLLVAAGGWIAGDLSRTSPIDWIYYTPDRLAEAKASDDVIVLDFTANWCLNCHALERSQLEQDRVVKLLNRDGVRPIKVDITAYEPAQRYLKEVGSATIPLLIVLDPQGETVFRSDAYRAAQVVEAIRTGLARRPGESDIAARRTTDARPGR